MVESRQAIERVIDEVWSRALGKIAKGRAVEPLRTSLGDEIDLVVPQGATATLMSANPAFGRVLYTSAYTSAKRNAYLMTRRLGMPPDFFWKFDYWSQERALDTLQKVIARVFATLMNRQKQGKLELVAVDVEHTRAELVFGDCVECAGMATSNPVCFFHAGLFAGILGALLDRDLDTAEMECTAQGSKACRFKVGKPEDRQIKIPLEERLGHVSLAEMDFSQRMHQSLGHQAVRELGNLVDVGYFQLLLSSVFLTHMDVISQACIAAGDEMGRTMAPMIAQRFPGSAATAISAFYHELRYTDIRIDDQVHTVEVQVHEAPEATGPLAQAALVPFLCGELQGLLGSLLHRPLRFQAARRNGATLILTFAP